MVKYWIEKTIVNERADRIDGERALGKVLWSPQKDNRGADIYKNMREVNVEDIILHLVDNKNFIGVSKVRRKAVETNGLPETNWENPSYLIELKDFLELSQPIHRSEVLNDKNKSVLNLISSKSEVFYNSNLNLRQGAYITPCPIELASLLNTIYTKNTGNNLPHVNLDDEPSLQDLIGRPFDIDYFVKTLLESGLRYSDELIIRFTASLLTKPFVILTGLSGSGKTKLAQAFVQWICQNKSQYSIIPVGADWTNREPLLGYPNALDAKEYIKPDSEALDRIIKANENPDLPYFLILDEMNLSHVERYFADFLSIMESKEGITLYSGEERKSSDGLAIPGEIKWPENLFIIGTVNIDETTYMFSPKVLDRANVIEFRISKAELEMYLGSNQKVDLSLLEGKGANMAADFVKLAKGNDYGIGDEQRLNEALVSFFMELKKTGAEFGYRSASEIRRFVGIAKKLNPDWDFDNIIDAAIMQKLLPKLHGSRSKLVGVLETLAKICLNDAKGVNIRETYFDAFKKVDLDLVGDNNVKFPISLEKICRMHKNVVDNGFTSYAEA